MPQPRLSPELRRALRLLTDDPDLSKLKPTELMARESDLAVEKIDTKDRPAVAEKIQIPGDQEPWYEWRKGDMAPSSPALSRAGRTFAKQGKELFEGFGHLAALGLEKAHNLPKKIEDWRSGNADFLSDATRKIESAKSIGKQVVEGTVENLKGWVTNPKKQLVENPISILDVGTVLFPVAKGVGAVGKLAPVGSNLAKIAARAEQLMIAAIPENLVAGGVKGLGKVPYVGAPVRMVQDTLKEAGMRAKHMVAQVRYSKLLKPELKAALEAVPDDAGRMRVIRVMEARGAGEFTDLHEAYTAIEKADDARRTILRRTRVRTMRGKVAKRNLDAAEVELAALAQSDDIAAKLAASSKVRQAETALTTELKKEGFYSKKLAKAEKVALAAQAKFESAVKGKGAEIPTYATLSTAEKKLYDIMKAQAETIKSEMVELGAPEAIFENIKYKQFAQVITGKTIPDLTEADIVLAKRLSDEMGLDLSYYPHVFPDKLLRGWMSGGQQLKSNPLPTRAGVRGFLGDPGGLNRSEQLIKAAEERLAAFEQAVATAPDRATRKSLLRRIEEGQAALADAKLTPNLTEQIMEAYEHYLSSSARRIRAVGFLDEFARTFGRKLQPGEIPDFDTHAIVDVGAYWERNKNIMQGEQAAIKSAARGESLDEAMGNVMDEGMGEVFKDVVVGKGGRAGPFSENAYVIDKKHVKNLQAELLGKDLLPSGVGVIDSVHELSRATFLYLSPRWHVNNIVSGAMLAVMGARNPLSFVRAAMKRFRDAVPEELYTGLYSKAEGMRADRIQKFLDANPKGPWWKKIVKNVTPIKWSQDFNTMVDSYFKRVIYLDDAVREAKRLNMVNAGRDLSEAVKALGASPGNADKFIAHANRFIPNYQALSPMERMVFRRFAPFYTFNRNMLLTAMRLPYTAPVKLRLMQKAMEFWHDASLDPFIEPYMRQGFPMGVDQDGNLVILRTGGMNPFGFAASVFEAMEGGADPFTGTLGQFVAQSGPLLSIGIQAATGRELFTGKSIDRPFVSFITGEIVQQDPKTGMITKITPQPDTAKMFADMFPQLNLVKRWVEQDAAIRPGVNLKKGTVPPRGPGDIAWQLAGLPRSTVNLAQSKEMRGAEASQSATAGLKQAAKEALSAGDIPRYSELMILYQQNRKGPTPAQIQQILKRMR